MRAHAELQAAALPAGRRGCRLARLRDAAPVAWRPTPDAVYLVGTAATPVGDDEVRIDIDVESGAELRLRSVAATVAWRGSGTGQHITARIASGGRLDWQPEPLIATAGCVHRQHARVDLAPDAHLRWVEELVLGRYGEAPGRLDLRLDIDVGGRPLLRHQLALGPGVPGWDSPATLDRWRCAGLLVLAGPGTPVPDTNTPSPAGRTPLAGTGAGPPRPGAATASPGGEEATAATFQLDGPGTLRLALAEDLPSLRAVLADGNDERTLP